LLDLRELHYRSIVMSAKLAGPDELKLQIDILGGSPKCSLDQLQHVLIAALQLPGLAEQ
jgi:hypothetical protein